MEIYGTIGDKCLDDMNGNAVPFKVLKSKSGHLGDFN